MYVILYSTTSFRGSLWSISISPVFMRIIIIFLVSYFGATFSTSLGGGGREVGETKAYGKASASTPGRLFSLAGRRPSPPGEATAEVVANGAARSYNLDSPSTYSATPASDRASAVANTVSGLRSTSPGAGDATDPQRAKRESNIFEPSQSTMKKTSGPERYIVLSLTRLGLANRLRSLADWVAIASMTKRKLLLNWVPSLECNATFLDLFETSSSQSFQMLPVFLVPGGAGVEGVLNMAQEAGLTFYRQPSGFDFFIDKTPYYSNVNVIYTDYDGVVTFDDTRCQDYMHIRSIFLRSLVPVQEVRAAVEQVEREYFQDKVIVGVHVREHDSRFDWAVVPPSPGAGGGEGDGSAEEFGEAISTIDFAQIMREVNDYMTPDRVLFYVSSNKNAVKKELQGMFSNMICLFGDSNRDRVEGIRFALIDWLLLSKTALVIHTYGSTFAQEAASVHMRSPVVGLWGSGAYRIRHTDIALDHCGNSLYMKFKARSTTKIEYTEGTVDKRLVAGRGLRYDPCSIQLLDWGISYTYCHHDVRPEDS